ncbi:MAG: DUF3885 domain-containing protein [Oscillospiraceae bacterium]|nr:DUF3885 domain-containing protein [Oscillospiraceae bacterium]
MSKIKQLIESQKFSYLQPYFYENQYAFRCELGIGETPEIWMENALKRALQIYRILFPDYCADALIFNQWQYDGEPEEDFSGILKAYRHHIVRNLTVYQWNEEYLQHTHRNRIICYTDSCNFDYHHIIENLLHENGHEESFVSYGNECIFSVYDDRGCDIVFADAKKYRDFYPLLEPYFLDYDRNCMKETLDKIL